MGLEIEIEHEDDVEVICPHCKKAFDYHYKGMAYTEVEPIENEGYD